MSLHFIAFLSLVGFYFIEVKVANHKSAAGSSQFFLPVFSGCIYPTSVYKMEVCWLDCSQYPTYLYIMDLLFGSSFILLDSFQLDLAVYPGISLISPRLRLPAQELFPSDPVFYSIVVLVEKRGSSTIL